MTLSEAVFILELTSPVLNEQDLKDHFRRIAKQTHPDVFQTFTEQTVAAEKFSRAKEAYEILLTHLKQYGRIEARETEQTFKPSPFRGNIQLPDWALLKEMERAFSFIYLIRSGHKLPAWLFNPRLILTVKKRPWFHNSWFSKLLNICWLFTVTFLFALFFIALFLIGFVLVITLLLFIPVFFLYDLLNKKIITVFEKRHGYKPSAFCGRSRGERAYLSMRTAPLLLINGMYILVFLKLSPSSNPVIFLPVFIGLFNWLCILNLSVGYEWICYKKFRKARNKSYTV